MTTIPRVTSVAIIVASLAGAGPVRAMGSAQPATVALAKQLDEYRRSLLTYFRAFDLLPILVPSGQQPGDVFDLKQKGVRVADARDCFPGLVVPPPTPSELPSTFQVSTDKADLALGAKALFTLGLGAQFENKMTVQYTDVKARTVSQQALKAAVSPSCVDVARIVSEEKVPVDAEALPRVLAVVGMVLTAKRRIFVGASSEADVDASASKLAAMFGGVGATLKAVGLDPSASASLGFGAKRGVMVESEDELPVAFLPAFLPEAVFAMQTLGDAKGPQALKWSPLVPGDATARSYLGRLIDADLAKP